jgi:hypothetical protein
MHFRAEILLRWWIVILLQGWWFGFGVAFASSDSVVMLSLDSPLVESGDRLFAVAADGHTLVSRSIDKSKHWMVVRNAPALNHIGGLASDSETLFVSDPDAGVVYKLPASGEAPSHISLGKDISQPGELALSQGVLFVADRATATVMSINLGDAEPTARLVFEGKPGHSPIYLATDADELLVASGKGDVLLRLNVIGNSNRPKAVLIQGDMASIKLNDEEGQPEISRENSVRSVYRGSETGDYPPIPRPGKLSAWNGLVYVIGGDGKLYVTPKLFPRAVEIPLDEAVKRPVGLLATDERLFVLDGETGNLIDLPRPLATEFVIEQRSSECSAFLYDYLNRNQLLPVREVPFEKSFEKTLKRAGALMGAYPKSLDGVICDLNPKLCKGKRRSAAPSNSIQPGEEVRIPVLFGETKLAYRRTALVAGESVGEAVDQAVVTERFAAKLTPGLLCELNSAFAKKSSNCPDEIRQQSGGVWVLPQEILRYVAAVPSAEVDGSQIRGGLRQLKKQCPGMLVNPLERRTARQQDTCSAPMVSDSEAVDLLYRQATREVIHYPQVPVSGTETIQVAIAESSIDYAHPDFRDEGGHIPFLLTNNPTLPAAGSTATFPFAIRPFKSEDHGTSVSYLIAGQKRHGLTDGMAGLAPRALLVPLTTQLNAIHSVFANSPYTQNQKTKIVNLSLKADSGEDAGLKQLLLDNPFTLFVVAAGNTREITDYTLCKDANHFFLPTCLGKEKNVLVVASTSLDGTRILEPPLNASDEPCDEGSVYDAKGEYVHVAAPGVGFYAAGNGGAYVPLRGTSFSAPLVTATAALLMSQGVTNPAAIKRRIIATSEPFQDKNEAKKVMGGLLHVENAIRWPHEATIILDGQQPLRARLELRQDKPPLRFPSPGGKEDKLIALDKILRIKRLSSGDYWVVFVVSDDETDQDVRVRRLSIPSGNGFTYQTLDIEGKPVGDKVTKNLDELKDFIAPVYE